MEMAENRQVLGLIKRAVNKGEATQPHLKRHRSYLGRIIRQWKTEMWWKCLTSAMRDKVRQALRYTKPGGQRTTKALRSRSGEVAYS